MAKKHATLSASGSHRWLHCPASVKLEANFPNEESEYAAEGTEAHELCELKLRLVFDEIDKRTFTRKFNAFKKRSKFYCAEMNEAADLYCKYVVDRHQELSKTCDDVEVMIEARLDFSRWVPGGFGTGDCVLVADGVVDVIDFKYGKGVKVWAQDNPQMQLYGLGAYELYDSLYDIDVVHMTIVQPRLTGIYNTAEASVTSLLDWAEYIVAPRAKMALDGTGPYRPGEDTCKFCKARESCKARAEQVIDAFDDVEEVYGSADDTPDVGLLTISEACDILARLRGYASLVTDLENFVFSARLDGKETPGWKVVEGRSSRKIIDEPGFVKRLKEERPDVDPYNKKLKGITDLEKELGRSAFTEIAGETLDKPKGKPTLVPASDKREDYNTEEDVLNAFDL